MTLRTLNYENYGIFLIMGHAGFCPSTVEGLEALALAGQKNPQSTTEEQMGFEYSYAMPL